MKALLILTIISIFAGESTYADSADPSVVSDIQLSKYAGRWFEIAHSPNFFQRKCLRSTAEYGMISDRELSVFNSCETRSGGISSIEGVAKIPDMKTPAKLKVRFNFFARGDYWVIMLDPDYQWAVVSGPSKDSLFILSRMPHLEPATQDYILNELKKRGFEELNDLIYDDWGPRN